MNCQFRNLLRLQFDITEAGNGCLCLFFRGDSIAILYSIGYT